MKIGGFQPVTLTDFPGRVASIVFTQGCNFRCPFCHNGALWSFHAAPESIIPEERIWSYLAQRCEHLDGVVVTGGEPTLHADLPAFLKRIKRMGFQVKLDTNGSRPGVLAGLIEAGDVDYIAMDIKAPLEHYSRLIGKEAPTREIEESIALLSWSGIEHEFRTTHVEPLLSERDLQAIRAMLPGSARYRVQPFRPENAYDPALRSFTEPYEAYPESGAA